MFDHESLVCYQLAVEVARWFRDTRFPRESQVERDQGRKSAKSILRNIAEGRSRRPEHTEAHFYRVAPGEAAEACATLDTVSIEGAAEQQEKLRRIGRMLRGLIRAVEAGKLGGEAEDHQG